MILLLVALASFQQGGFTAGDKWAVERTSRYINESAAIDFTRVEQIQYSVESVSASGVTLNVGRVLTETRSGKDRLPPPTDLRAKMTKLTFSVAGTPTFKEDPEDPVSARVDRILWAAAEERNGVSWSRSYPLSPGIPAGKVVVRPTAAKADERTLALTYAEMGDVRGEATATVRLSKRIVTSLKLTLRGVILPSGNKPATAVVNQVLLEPK